MEKLLITNKRRVVILAMVIALFVIMQPFVSENVFGETATGTKVTYKGPVSSMGSTCGKFEIKGRIAFCAEHTNATPTTGTKIIATKLLTNDTMRKALYYGYSGPEAKVKKDKSGWVSTSIALSRANGKGGGTNEAQKFYKSLKNYSVPPESFKVYYCNTKGDKQDLCYWIYEPEGKVRVKKESSDANATSSRGYSLAGAVYGVYKDKTCYSSCRVAKLNTGSTGYSSKITLDKGTYYIKEITAPKGFSISSTVYSVSITDQCDKTVTVKDAPKKGKIQLVKSSDNPDITNNNSAFSLSGAEYGVWSDSARTKKVGTLKTTSSGKSNILSVWAGTYYIKETIAPKGYEKDSTIYKLSVSVASIGTTKILKVKDTPKKGKLQLVKSSAEPEITDGNNAYSLSGAKYGVWSDSSLTKKVGTLTTKSNGTSNVISVWPGTYYVKESTAPKGYLKDSTIHKVTVTSENFSTVKTIKVKDSPESDPAWVMIQKIDSESEDSVPSGNSDMSGAEFVVKYYEGTDWDENPDNSGETELRKWVFKTNESGYICLDDEKYFVSGDELYYNERGNPTIPIGTITIHEIKAPVGYEINHETYMVKILKDDNQPGVSLSQIPTTIVKEQPIRGDLEIFKINSVTGEPLEGVSFDVIDVLDNEMITTLTTDINGYATTASDNEPNGSLPFGEYIIREKETPIGYLPIKDIKIAISENREIVNLKIENAPAEIKTAASFKENGLKETLAKENTVIVDEVRFKNLIPGTEYRIEGVLMDTVAKEPLIIEDEKVISSKTFIPETSEGTVKIEFIFNGENLAGKSLTVFEELYIAEVKVASHTDITDKEQTVTITGAGDIEINKTDSKTGKAMSGVTFEVVSALTNEVKAMLVTDENGYATTASETSTEGSLNFGDYIVREKDVPIGYVPADDINIKITENKQIVTLEIENTPAEIETRAFFKENNAKEILPIEAATIVDEVRYSNLIPGKTYRIEGLLMDKVSCRPLLINKAPVKADMEFIPETADGVVYMEFFIDASTLMGKSVTVFEELYVDGTLIANHTDLNDENQTVVFINPAAEEVPDNVDTGDKTGRVIPLIIVIIIISFMGVLVSLKPKKHNSK